MSALAIKKDRWPYDIILEKLSQKENLSLFMLACVLIQSTLDIRYLLFQNIYINKLANSVDVIAISEI